MNRSFYRILLTLILKHLLCAIIYKETRICYKNRVFMMCLELCSPRIPLDFQYHFSSEPCYVYKMSVCGKEHTDVLRLMVKFMVWQWFISRFIRINTLSDIWNNVI